VQLAAAEGRTGPLRIVVLVLSVGLTWILVSILFGRPGSGFPRIQQGLTWGGHPGCPLLASCQGLRWGGHPTPHYG
uniref:Uncharacterized protein n=1 Tax=Sus scrofa TaxID=9823 RepID=A0A8D0UZE8_PIG